MDVKDVEILAQLARIELSEDEKKSLLKDMDSILGYVKQIEQAKVENAAPEYKIYNIWREDSPAILYEEKSFSYELIVEQFPDAQDGSLKVKKIL